MAAGREAVVELAVRHGKNKKERKKERKGKKWEKRRQDRRTQASRKESAFFVNRWRWRSSYISNCWQCNCQCDSSHRKHQSTYFHQPDDNVANSKFIIDVQLPYLISSRRSRHWSNDWPLWHFSRILTISIFVVISQSDEFEWDYRVGREALGYKV